MNASVVELRLICALRLLQVFLFNFFFLRFLFSTFKGVFAVQFPCRNQNNYFFYHLCSTFPYLFIFFYSISPPPPSPQHSWASKENFHVFTSASVESEIKMWSRKQNWSQKKNICSISSMHLQMKTNEETKKLRSGMDFVERLDLVSIAGCQLIDEIHMEWHPVAVKRVPTYNSIAHCFQVAYDNEHTLFSPLILWNFLIIVLVVAYQNVSLWISNIIYSCSAVQLNIILFIFQNKKWEYVRL